MTEIMNKLNCVSLYQWQTKKQKNYYSEQEMGISFYWFLLFWFVLYFGSAATAIRQPDFGLVTSMGGWESGLGSRDSCLVWVTSNRIAPLTGSSRFRPLRHGHWQQRPGLCSDVAVWCGGLELVLSHVIALVVVGFSWHQLPCDAWTTERCLTGTHEIALQHCFAIGLLQASPNNGPVSQILREPRHCLHHQHFLSGFLKAFC